MKNMKSKRILVLSVVGILAVLLISSVGLTLAVELKGFTGGSLNALDSGYAITRWPWDGGELFPGEDATVRACSINIPVSPNATQVVFRWIQPDGFHWDTAPKALTASGDTWDGKPVWDAYDTQTINMTGDWGVQALFVDSEGRLQGPNPYPIVAIRAISWHAIPEVPLGTVAAIASMVGALGVFAFVKKRRGPSSIL